MLRHAMVVVGCCSVVACSPVSPGGTGGGSGGGSISSGGGSATGGGTATGGGSTTGGGSATGGGIATGGGTSTGGGAATGGGMGALFLPFSVPSVESTLAVDSTGRVHAGALGWLNTNQLVYSTCATGCDRLANWQTVQFGSVMAADQTLAMKVTADGRPRMTIVRTGGGIDYYACESGCLTASNWTVTNAVPSSMGVAVLGPPSYDDADYFAIDAQGAALLFATSTGKALARCPSACTLPGNWTVSVFSGDLPLWTDAHLLITPSGGLAVSTGVTDYNATPSQHLGYFECAATADCTQGANWPGVLFNPTEAQVRHSLTFDAQGHARLAALYDATDPMLAGSMHLFECDGTCADPASWVVLHLPWTQAGTHAQQRIAVSFGAQNQAFLAYRGLDTASVARCTTNCAANTAGWTQAQVLSSTVLDPALPFTNPCALGSWIFDDGHLSLAPLGSGYAIDLDIKAIASGGTCTSVSTYDYRTAVRIVP